MTLPDDERLAQVRHLLDPDRLNQQLVAASLYLVGFELLDFSLVTRIRDFLTLGGGPESLWRDELLKFSGENDRERSARWLVTMGAIDEAEAGEIRALVDHRNEIAHELVAVLMERSVRIDHLDRIRALVEKIELWWILEVEIPSSPLFDGRKISGADVRPGPVVLMDLLLSVTKAFANAPEQVEQQEAPG